MSKRPPMRPPPWVVQAPGVFSVAVGLRPVALVEKLGGFVANHADLAGQGQPGRARALGQIVAARPVGVVLNGFSLEMVERQPHGRKRRHTDDDRPLHALGVVDSPLQGLHAAQRRRPAQPQPPDAEGIQKQSLCPYIVADGNERKVRTVEFSGLGVDRAGSRGAVTGTQHVGYR